MRTEVVSSSEKRSLFVLLIVRAVSLFVIGILAGRYIPYLGAFPYIKDQLHPSNLPAWLYSWANFDGVHYIKIAEDGYHQFDQAFFPLYPVSIRIVHLVIQNYVLSGLMISHIAFVLALFTLYRYTRLVWDKQMARWITLFLCAFPTAFFFSALYTESLFLLLTTSALFFSYKKNYRYAGIFAALSSFTRLQGILLIIPFACMLYDLKKPISTNLRAILSRWQNSLLLVAPCVGVLGYMLYLALSTGDPLYFLTSQPVFGANRSDHLILLPHVYYRYFRIFLTADITFQYWISILEFMFVSIALILAGWHVRISWMRRRTYDVGIALFSLAHVMLPTLTGTFSSTPRYTLFAISIYIVLANLKSWRVKVLTLTGFTVLQVILTALFIQGYFVS